MDATIAREYGLPDLDFEYDRHYNQVATFELGPFIFTVKKEYDEYAEYEGGKGIDTPEPGAIRHHGGYREWKWFLPETTAEEHYKELARDSRWTIDEARTEASKYAMQDFQRWNDYGNGWSYISIVVAITYMGYEIGAASCGGIESDSDDEHFLTIAWEDLDEAISDAIKALAEFVDPPTYLLVELSEKLDAAFKGAYEKQRAEWTGPSFAHKPFDPTNFPRDPKDIPPYEPVDEDEYRIIYCARCDNNNITDDEDQYGFGKKPGYSDPEFVVCCDCYYELYEEAEAELIRHELEHDDILGLGDRGYTPSFGTWQVEAQMAKMYKEELTNV